MSNFHTYTSMFLIEIVTMAPFKRPMSKATKKAAWKILVHNMTSTRSVYIYVYRTSPIYIYIYIYRIYTHTHTYIEIFVTQKILQLPWHKID